MAWCRQAANHYLSQCWPRYMSPYGVIRPQWVKEGKIYSLSSSVSLPASRTHLVHCKMLCAFSMWDMYMYIQCIGTCISSPAFHPCNLNNFNHHSLYIIYMLMHCGNPQSLCQAKCTAVIMVNACSFVAIFPWNAASTFFISQKWIPGDTYLHDRQGTIVMPLHIVFFNVCLTGILLFYCHLCLGTSLVQVMDCHLYGAKPLPLPVLGPYKETAVRFW